MNTTTTKSNAELNTILNDAISNRYGQTAAALTLAAILNQLSFSLGMAFTPKDSNKTKAPTLSDDERAFYGLDNGLPTRQTVEPLRIAEGFVAAQYVLANLIRTPDPETGKRPQWAANYFRDATMIAQNVTDWQAKRNTTTMEANAKAFEAVGAKINKVEAQARIEAAKESNKAAMIAQIDQCIRSVYASTSFADLEEATECALAVCTELGLDMADRVLASLENVVARQTERFNRNEFATIDPSVVSMMLAMRPTKPDPATE